MVKIEIRDGEEMVIERLRAAVTILTGLDVDQTIKVDGRLMQVRKAFGYCKHQAALIKQ